MKTSTVAAVSIGTAVTALVAYAVYFDHKRRTDPNFRKALQRESKRHAKAARKEAEAQNASFIQNIKDVVRDAKEEGFPTDTADKEAYFMEMVSKGEAQCADTSNPIDAALSFYRALKVYPAPQDIIGILDKTVPKEVLDVLAQMIALDPSLSVQAFGGPPNGGPFGPAGFAPGDMPGVGIE
ncbi:MAG: hypothetical protein M1834_007603 [Cirrosporium novae-zelandiae]|nr:MAG: hypothetical protein M1834_007603 [Cirrosporium novae-zelandiae]